MSQGAVLSVDISVGSVIMIFASRFGANITKLV